MGSWCATCGISRMPIREGQEVKGLLIVKKNDQTGSSCYIDDWWKPIGLPIDIKYADYGNFELVNPDDSNAARLLEYLKDNAIPMEQGDNKYHDLPVVPSEFTWEKVNDIIHEERLMLKNYSKIKQYVAWFPIHPIVYEALVRPFYAWGIQDAEHLRTTESTMENIRGAFNYTETESESNIKDSVEDKAKHAVVSDMLKDMNLRNELDKVFGSFSGMEHFIVEDDDHSIKVGAELVHMKGSMNRLRIPFNPVTGLGGQSDVEDYDTHKALCEAITKQGQFYIDYYKELWGDDE